MISVGVGDGRKGIGLGLGFSEAGMEETEIEEGEAYEDSSTIDPDIALPYIDKKLRDVLGHFRKDFEGVVTAENLGAKFGEYGSFLPTYQRSPVCPRPKTPHIIHRCSTSKSHNNPNLEGCQTNSLLPSSASLLPSKGSTSTSTHPLRDSANDFLNKNRGISSEYCAEESSSCREMDKNFPQDSERSLRVRIKVVSDNLSAQKNAEIYSGLGLDISPSLSAGRSPIGSEGSLERFNLPEESPTTILQIMTSSPIYGGLVLSPLHDDLIYLSEKQKCQGESKREGSQQVPPGKHSDRVKGGSKTNLSRIKGVELNDNPSNKGSQDENGPHLKEDKIVVKLAGEGPVDEPRIANKMKRQFSDLTKGKILEAAPRREIGLEDNPSGTNASAGKLFEGEEVNFSNNVAVNPRKDNYLKGDLIGDFATADSNVSSRNKAQNTELVDLPELKISNRATFLEDGSSALGSKNKSDGSERKNAHANINLPEGEVEDSKLQKDLERARSTYKDFFGDMELEQNNDVDSEEMVSTNRPEDFGSVEKCASKVKSKDFESVGNCTTKITPKDSESVLKCASKIKSKEKLTSKKVDKQSVLKDYPKAAPSAGPIKGSGPSTEAVVGSGALVPLVKEDWVCCDKCQKWRLLPLGTNPESLPEKWLCSMLNWLPGMNRCSFSEEETTKALVACYQLPAHGGGPHESSVAAGYFNQKHKKYIKDVSASVNQDRPVSNSMMNNPRASSVKCSELTRVNQSPLVNEKETQRLSKSSAVEKHRPKQKEKRKLLEQNPERGEIRKKRDAELGRLSVSKKAKVDNKHSIDNVCMRDHDGPLGNVGPTPHSGLSLIASGQDLDKNDIHLTGDRKRDTNNKSKGPLRNSSNHGTEKKRKMSESHLLHGNDSLEAASENEDRMEKKARVSRSTGKETSGSKGVGGHKKCRSVKDQQFGSDLGSMGTKRTLDPMVAPKRDLGSVQPSQATSSSSKVSGSHKNRITSKEVKGSPVESVSSSPLRDLNQDKSVSMGSLDGKGARGDAALFTIGKPRRCSNREDDGGSDGFNRVREAGNLSGLDFRQRDDAHLPGSEADGGTDITDIENQHEPQDSYQCVMEEQGDEIQYSTRLKSVKGSSSRSKNAKRTSQIECDEEELKVPNSSNESIEHASYDESRRTLNTGNQEQIGIGIYMVENDILIGQDESEVLGENSKRNIVKYRGDNRLGDEVYASSLDHNDNLQIERDEISSKRLSSHKLALSGGGQSVCEAPPHLLSKSQKENEAKSSLTDATTRDNALKASKMTRRPGKQSGNQLSKLAHLTPNGQKVKHVDAPSPARRDPSHQANIAMKEAKDLKHLADRMKNSGSTAESTSLYFQAALKFIHGASLLESCNSESAKKGEMLMSMQVYSSTAKLCEFCAHEYEKCKDMAAAALAYKLVEVAYMKVIYSLNTNASEDRHELERALQILPLGESPSSSASDIDNLNNPATLDKAPLAKGVDSPQVIGNHGITARNCPKLVRILNFAQDVNCAMEASRKSRSAFAAANARTKEARCIASVKEALDFSFHDVEGVLRLVRIAIDAISG